MKTALITGITGQDGSYLAEFLLGKGYEVHGIVRRASMFNRSRIEHLRADPEIYGKRLFLHYADLQDATPLRRILQKSAPDEIYHLAGQSHVGLSFDIPESTVHEVATATLSILEICRDLPKLPRFYHASSSEVFGSPDDSPQTERTPYRPENPYGCSKAFATQMVRVYRKAHGLFAVSGIAYNHESSRRGENFVTKKIVRSAAEIAKGGSQPLVLGNLDSERDWGFAPEYVEAMWLMLQHEVPQDLVLATGSPCSVRSFTKDAFAAAGIQVAFEGEGESEIGRNELTGETIVRVSPEFFRKIDTTRLVGDPQAALNAIGWRARTIGGDVARKMLLAEM
ncbi:GDP-mannose 4,6-dehydratase [Puniceicoccus vermicola]|uniref:GDP-mannose 4,6-dehydratase n=1 Tax=Puniceicoccus vermicola TaxID=388746 RepID=A0A7X1AW54_9BACT|nr:GDP-mannose 4,6-dehydratase [Puniceicoccus vermicola]MBC2601081.1 GDP-mannose 4,6-dehydratase [Puniceicoccus vermicola]